MNRRGCFRQGRGSCLFSTDSAFKGTGVRRTPGPSYAESVENRHDPLALAVTGASGAIYALRTIAALLERGCRLEIVFSEFGRRLLCDEVGADAKVDRLQDLLVARYGDGIRHGSFVVH